MFKVVALTMFDLRRRNKVDRLGLCGVEGTKFPQIRAHFKKMIEDVYEDMETAVETFPSDHVTDPTANIKALNTYKRGDAVIIFTPDNTHFDIALACVEKGLHVLITKPAVSTLTQHFQLYEAAIRNKVLVAIEVHKRWDPIYVDARDRIQALGPFSYMYAYMSQPKYQLHTFGKWAGKSSDISYYLNSHHIDFHEWCMGNKSRPILVVGTASTGAANTIVGQPCEDSITLTVTWENTPLADNWVDTGRGVAVYTASWIAPKSDVHSQQRFFYAGQRGEVTVDQAHRGYTLASDDSAWHGLQSINPLFMKYAPSDGKFNGQNGYGYRYDIPTTTYSHVSRLHLMNVFAVP